MPPPQASPCTPLLWPRTSAAACTLPSSCPGQVGGLLGCFLSVFLLFQPRGCRMRRWALIYWPAGQRCRHFSFSLRHCLPCLACVTACPSCSRQGHSAAGALPPLQSGQRAHLQARLHLSR
jgi:hypothetical protein